MQRRTIDFWLQSLSSLLPFKPHSVHLQDTFQGSLVLTQTNAYNTDARSCKHTLSILDICSLQHAPKSTAWTPKILIISSASTLHINCIETLHNCSTKSLAQRRVSTTSQVAVKTKQKPKTNYPECCKKHKNKTNYSESSSCLLLLPPFCYVSPSPKNILPELPYYSMQPPSLLQILPTAFSLASLPSFL